jgi:hypothetical protein
MNTSIRVIVLALVSFVLGAAVGAGIVYKHVALRYRKLYEATWLAELEGSLRLVENLRSGKTPEEIKRYDIYLGRSALALHKEVTRSLQAEYLLWEIKQYYRDHQLPVRPDLESLFKQIPDKEPDGTRGSGNP